MSASSPFISGHVKKKIGVLGASGYTGADAVRLLARHPGVEISALTANAHARHALIPASDHRARSEPERRKGGVRIELCALGIRSARVVEPSGVGHRYQASGPGQGTGPDHEIRLRVRGAGGRREVRAAIVITSAGSGEQQSKNRQKKTLHISSVNDSRGSAAVTAAAAYCGGCGVLTRAARGSRRSRRMRPRRCWRRRTGPVSPARVRARRPRPERRDQQSP